MMGVTVESPKCPHNLAVARWRTVDILHHPRDTMVRRGWLALLLTTLMLSSGCLGLLGDDERDDDSELIMKENIPLVLSLTSDTEFEFDQPVVLSGLCNCE